ncbi:hypothetical protein [Staphylococcus sp. 11261D007BR]
MKKLIAICLSGSFLLASCGSQNLLPLEEKSTDLSDKNHEIRLENQELKNDINQKQQQLDSLNIDKKDTKQAQTNQKKASYWDASSKYYQNLDDIIQGYLDIDSDIVKNKKKDDIIEQLDQLIDQHDTAKESYEEDIDEAVVKKSSDIKSQHNDIKKTQETVSKAFDKIKQGYEKKDKETIKEGRNALTNIDIKTDNEDEQDQ